MKKNTMLRVASFLLVAVLLSTSVISGTFAKYVTAGSATDTARVAKWGVTIAANGGAFSEQYKASDGKISTTYAAATDSVHSGTSGEKVVAPGTGDSVVATSLSGTPEVDTQVTFASTVTLTGWTVNNAEYCPIIFTVGGATYGTNDTTATNKSATVSELQTAVQNAINASSATYEAGTNLSGASSPAVSWEWPFSVAGNDAKDTALGDTAVNGTAATITIALDITVTQVD